MSILSDSQILERHTSTLGRPAAIWHRSGLMWVVDPPGLLVLWAARARVHDCRKGFSADIQASLPDRKEPGQHAERSSCTTQMRFNKDPLTHTNVSKCRTQKCEAGMICHSDGLAGCATQICRFTSSVQLRHITHPRRDAEDSFVVNHILR
jgi:hypothetical protein